VITPVTVPYLTVATFKASPTFLDYGLLNTASTVPADQDAELYNQLLKASAWASNTVCNLPLHAHYNTEQRRLRVGRDGLLKWLPTDLPVRLITGFSYGYSPGAPNLRPVIDLTQQWIEGDAQVVMPFGPLGPGFNQIQFSPPGPTSELYTSWTYIAGYPNSTLANAPIAGAVSLQVKDPTGILAGDVLRIWEPGKEEAVTVAPSYVTGAVTVPLTAGLVNAHTIGAGISAMPPDAIQAVTNYTIALLMRPDTSAEDQFPDNAPTTGTRGGDARKSAGGLIAEATRLLASYARVR
jgi:hypothetical protein